MVAPAVGLDDETAGREVEVDLVVVEVGVGDFHVAERPGQAGAPAQRAEAALELTAREGGIVGRGHAQGPGSAAAAVAFQHVEDRAAVIELVADGQADRMLEVVPRRGDGEVEEGPGEGGDRHAPMRGGIAGIEGACAVQADSRGACFRRGCGDARLRRVVHHAPLAMSEFGERSIDARAVFAKHVFA